MSDGVPGPTPGLGRRLGPFTLLRRVALGASAELFEARLDQSLPDASLEAGQVVALKRLLPHALEDLARVDAFIAEAQLALALEHPHIVRTLALISLDLGLAIVWPPSRAAAGSARLEPREAVRDARPPGEPLLVMELLAWARPALWPGEAAPPEICAAVGLAAAEALAAVHALGAVHGDVSASNLLITPDGRVVLVDFGSARLADREVTQPASLRAGKARYASPEQQAGLPPTPQSDLYSLGVLLERLASGGAQPGDAPRGQSAPESSADLRALIRACVEPNPADRPSSARALADSLAAWLAARPGPRPSPDRQIADWWATGSQAAPGPLSA
ncbi:MAG: protein kinase [Myxococcota bacterium]